MYIQEICYNIMECVCIFSFFSFLISDFIKVFRKEEKTKYTSILNNLVNGDELLGHLHIARLYERMKGCGEGEKKGFSDQSSF